jgi:hypothetical protein
MKVGSFGMDLFFDFLYILRSLKYTFFIDELTDTLMKAFWRNEVSVYFILIDNNLEFLYYYTI